MDAARSRGHPRGRGSRGGRGGRGKATRARGAQTRGLRVPPEYLQRVIAERQGLDPSALPDEDEEEREGAGEEAAERERQYRPRELGTNADRYKELEGDDLGEQDEELAKETARILEKVRLRDLSELQSPQSPGGGPSTSSRNGKGRPSDDDDDGDVDRALEANLKALRGDVGQRGKAQMIMVEWDGRMEAMSKEKAEAEARAALKARFRGQTSTQSLNSRNVAPLGGTAGSRPSGAGGDIGNSGDSAKKLDELEDFLDDLLG